MPIAKHVFKLSAEERALLQKVADDPKAAQWKSLRAKALLLAEIAPGGPGWTDAMIAKAHRVTTRSLESWRRKAVEFGPLSLLEKNPGPLPRRPRKLDGEQEAQLVALACSQAPAGQARWTLKLLAKRLVELEVVDSIAPETVRRTLKKTS